MDGKKPEPKILESMKPGSKQEILKRSFSNLKKGKAHTSIKKVGRSRTQKGHKNY